eukprot:12661013-Alexandrium_andersonii.AAC.1
MCAATQQDSSAACHAWWDGAMIACAASSFPQWPLLLTAAPPLTQASWDGEDVARLRPAVARPLGNKRCGGKNCDGKSCWKGGVLPTTTTYPSCPRR